jgi:hypothetical protein
LEELDKDLVDKLVLSDGLDHEHPLLPEEPQHHGYFHLLQEKRKSSSFRQTVTLASFFTPSFRITHPLPMPKSKRRKELCPAKVL